MIEIVFVGIIALILSLWFLHDRNQKETMKALNSSIQTLKDDADIQKQQGDKQTQDMTTEKVSSAALHERTQQSEKQIDELKQTLAVKETNIDTLNRELSDYKSNIVELETRLAEERKAAVEKLAFLEDAKEKLGNEFKVLANQIFEEKGKAFSEQSRSSLNEVLKPMREQLGDFRTRIDEVHLHDSKDRASLKEQLLNLQTLNIQMNDEARSLTRALKGDKKVQGDWGELILETVLEQSGLRKGIEYSTQGGFRDADNKLRKPDVILNLPDGKHMIIDSKVSLVAYNDYMNAADEQARELALGLHIQSVRNHIDELSGKDYSSLHGLKAPDFVFMFMPIEASFMVAFQQDEKLFSKAFESNIVVVTPTTLLATLRTVENIWRYERQNENAKKIADKAGAVYDKLRGFLDDFEKIGKQLDTVQTSYDGALNKLSQGKGNLIRQAEAFVELGVKVKKQLPKSIVDEASLHEIEETHPAIRGEISN